MAAARLFLSFCLRNAAGLTLGYLVCSTGHAQVFSGLSENGSIVLSSFADASAPTLLLDAEKVPIQHTTSAIGSAHYLDTIPPTFKPFIEEASATFRVPPELIHAVITVESNYNQLALSPKGARGLMQIMPATATRFGSNGNFEPRQNILTGSRYLRWLLDYFNDDMELTIAAYNAGEGAVMRAGRKIPRFTETENYVPKVLSIYRKAKRQT
jgi:soluble lytic murein transglycosylase-like protein